VMPAGGCRRPSGSHPQDAPGCRRPPRPGRCRGGAPLPAVQHRRQGRQRRPAGARGIAAPSRQRNSRLLWPLHLCPTRPTRPIRRYFLQHCRLWWSGSWSGRSGCSVRWSGRLVGPGVCWSGRRSGPDRYMSLLRQRLWPVGRVGQVGETVHAPGGTKYREIENMVRPYIGCGMAPRRGQTTRRHGEPVQEKA
jgi:hypothetical protein